MQLGVQFVPPFLACSLLDLSSKLFHDLHPASCQPAHILLTTCSDLLLNLYLSSLNKIKPFLICWFFKINLTDTLIKKTLVQLVFCCAVLGGEYLGFWCWKKLKVIRIARTWIRNCFIFSIGKVGVARDMCADKLMFVLMGGEETLDVYKTFQM